LTQRFSWNTKVFPAEIYALIRAGREQILFFRVGKRARRYARIKFLVQRSYASTRKPQTRRRGEIKRILALLAAALAKITNELEGAWF